ncbi:MAG TPA: cupin domain-containing protein, partial [Pirellulaceae bacterium]|nr:cupin domain-containing protein [Pirellulaceae bacterium]
HSREQLAIQPHTHLLVSVADLPSIWSATTSDAAAASAFVTNENEMPAEPFDWGTLKWLSNEKLSPGAEQTLGICHILPGQRNPLHYHPNCEEVLYMISGQGQHGFDGELIPLAAGSTIRIPAGVKHNLANTGSETITCLISFSSGRRETVFLE